LQIVVVDLISYEPGIPLKCCLRRGTW